MSARDAAVQAAARGWFVFPARPGGKEPRPGLSWPEAATSDLGGRAAARWRRGEGYGVAAKLSGLVILDLDKPKPGYVLPPRWRTGRTSPASWTAQTCSPRSPSGAASPDGRVTFTVITPSGGMHLYYVAPAGRNIGNRPLGPMIDVRGGGEGNGGYVLGPGNVLNGTRYEIADDQDPQPLPAWIADLLDPPRCRGAAEPGPSAPLAGSVHARMRGLLSHVLDGQPHDRNGRVYWAACRVSELVAAGLVDRTVAEEALVAAAVASGLQGGEPEARRTIASGLRAAG